MKKLVWISLLCTAALSAQNFTKKDSLHGGFGLERTCYDIKKYDLNIKINPDEKSIKGFNEITFQVDDATQKIQLDLFENMKIDKIEWKNKPLKYKRQFNAVFITFPQKLNKGEQHVIKFHYSGKPIIAANAPWDGGFVFEKDSNNKHWIGVAVQGDGASIWYPCKDGQSDEPDNGAIIRVAVPNGLMNVSNGRLIGEIKQKDGYTRWDWEVKNPINNYDITINIADYAHFHENYNGLDMDFYVLKVNEEKAKKHFEADVKPMMDCFQSKFGEYPFKEDSYKLVETSYLGMEHQSAVAYGNKFRKGYLGADLSGTGLGMFFDYITIHETAHEWFGNSITAKDIADMWIQEGFTTYAESVFIECQKGYDAGQDYILGQRRRIMNDRPIVGFYGVNNEGSGDMYFKGSNIINTLRHILNDDTKWWATTKKFHETFKKKIVTKDDVVNFFAQEIGSDCKLVFEHYITQTKNPKLSIKKSGNQLVYWWTGVDKDFKMPVEITLDGKSYRINATTMEQNLDLKNSFKLEDIRLAKKKFLVDLEVVKI